MDEAVFYLAGLAGVFWLAEATIDILDAVVQRDWRFRTRNVMIMITMISLVLGLPSVWLFVLGWAIIFVAFFSLAIMLYTPTRFSLRTLLIATTLVAVGLGLVVWRS